MTSTQRYGRTCSVFVRGACGPDLHHREGSAGWLSVTVGMPYPWAVHFTFHPDEVLTATKHSVTGWNNAALFQMQLSRATYPWEDPTFTWLVSEILVFSLAKDFEWFPLNERLRKVLKYFHVTLTHQQREELLVWLDTMREQGLAA